MMSETKPPSLEPETTEQIEPGLTCEWYLEKKIVVYRLTMVSQALVDRWAALTSQVLTDWNKERPYLALHDLSHPGVSLQFAMLVNFDTVNIGITPSGRINAEDILDTNPNFYGYVAVNFNLSVSGQVNKVLANQRTRHPFVKYRTFYNRDNALAWLQDASNA